MHGTIPLPQHVFMAWCLVKHRDNFTFINCNNLCVYRERERERESMVIEAMIVGPRNGDKVIPGIDSFCASAVPVAPVSHTHPACLYRITCRRV